MTRRQRVLFAGLVALSCAQACSGATDCSGPGPLDLTGAWTYAATQSTPAPAALGGTLTVGSQCGTTLTGSLDVIQTDPAGSRRVAGPVNGTTVDTVAVDFDAFFNSGVGRRHLGLVRGDSIVGSWAEITDAGTATGTFTAVRQVTP